MANKSGEVEEILDARGWGVHGGIEATKIEAIESSLNQILSDSSVIQLLFCFFAVIEGIVITFECSEAWGFGG
jgi:hypothetical protein